MNKSVDYYHLNSGIMREYKYTNKYGSSGTKTFNIKFERTEILNGIEYCPVRVWSTINDSIKLFEIVSYVREGDNGKCLLFFRVKKERN